MAEKTVFGLKAGVSRIFDLYFYYKQYSDLYFYCKKYSNILCLSTGSVHYKYQRIFPLTGPQLSYIE